MSGYNGYSKSNNAMETTHEVVYGCETKDGGTGFGEGRIVCENETDARGVWQAIQENPSRFDFQEPGDGRKLVRISGDSFSTRYLD